MSITPVSQAILSSAGPVRRTRNRDSQSRPRASRKPNHDDPQDMQDRISDLLPFSKRIMGHYAGNELAGRLRTLEELEEYQRQHNVDPIARHETQWECRICSHNFKTFQKAAIHVTSHEWKLRSWYCLQYGCQRRYGSSNELTRHKKDPHPASNVSAATMPATMPPETAPTATLTIPTTVHRSQSTRIARRLGLSAEITPFHHSTGPSWTAHRQNRASPLPDPPEAYQQQLSTIGALCACFDCTTQAPYMTRQVHREPTETTILPDQYPNPLQPAEMNAGPYTFYEVQYPPRYATDPHAEYPLNADNETTGQYYGSPVASTSQQRPSGAITASYLYPAHRYTRQVNNLSGISPDTQYDSQYDPTAHMSTYPTHQGMGNLPSRAASGSRQDTPRNQ